MAPELVDREQNSDPNFGILGPGELDPRFLSFHLNC